MLDPIAFKIGPLSVHWYGISYGVGLVIGIWILTKLNKIRKVFSARGGSATGGKNNGQIFDFAFWIFLLGVMLGGRLGYVLFYNLPYYIGHPTKILAVWDGGMSFHGGLIASLIVGYLFCKKYKIKFFDVVDMAVIPGALALTFTRIANFINHELIGRPIGNPKWEWMGVDFGDGVLRYPSQLFQSASALILFLILLLIFTKKPKRGVLFFSYLMLYGLFRAILEFWRAPDPQVGFIWQYFTLGQMLSFGMFIGGVIGMIAIKFFRKSS